MHIGRWLFGFRDDLELNKIWWHRLFQVVGTIAMLLLLAASLLIAHSEYSPETTLENVRIIATLRDFIKQSPKDIFNVTPEFLKSPGELGQLQDSRIVFLYSADVAKRMCTPDPYQHIAEVVAYLNGHKNDSVVHTVSSEAKLLESAGIRMGESACYDPDDVTLPDASNIVKYEFTSAALATKWAKAIGVTSGIVTIAFILVTNLYYRGLVYVICGPRRK